MSEISVALQGALVDIVLVLISTLAVIGVACINLLRKKILANIASIEDNQMRAILQDTVNKTADLVASVVMSIEQEEKQEIIKAMEDGTMDRNELLNLKNIAVDRVCNQLGSESLEILSEEFGNVAQYIGDLVSQQVLLIKNNNM